MDAELSGAVALRHRLHAAPEVSGDEAATAAAVVSALGAGPGEPSAGTGRVLRVGPPGPAVAVRAELDALPLVEATERPVRRGRTARCTPAGTTCTWRP